MADEYTPTIEELGWAWVAYRPGNRPVREVLAELDRALAAHDAEIRRDQAEKDARIARRDHLPRGYNPGALNRGSRSEWYARGRDQAAEAIRAQFTPSPKTEQETE